MSPAYQLLVMQHYEKKRNENGLSLRLSQPTAARLKAESLDKFKKGFSTKDRKILVDFFGGKGDDETILKRIKDYEPDFFKPLLNYLNKKTSKPDPKNIELLAWLTDFEERPYDYRKEYPLDGLQTNISAPETILNVTQNKKGRAG